MEENQMVDPGLQRHAAVMGGLVPPPVDQSQNSSGDPPKLSRMIVKDNKKFYIDLVSLREVCDMSRKEEDGRVGKKKKNNSISNIKGFSSFPSDSYLRPCWTNNRIRIPAESF